MIGSVILAVCEVYVWLALIGINVLFVIAAICD